MYVKTMSAHGSHLGCRLWSPDTILKVYYPRIIDDMFAILADWFQEKILKHFLPIGSYVKTMSAEGGHLGWRSGSPDTILKIDHLRTIHAMFALNWLTGFRGEDF